VRLRNPGLGLARSGLILRVSFALAMGNRFHQIDEIGFDATSWQLASTHVLGTNALVPTLFFGSFYTFSAIVCMAKLGQAVVASALPWLNAGLTEK